MATFFLYLMMTLFVIVCAFMILLVLVQKGRGGGLAGAFGGMGGNTAFGSKTGDVLTWTTAVVFGVFIVLAIVLNLVINAQYGNDRSKAVSATTTPPAAAAGAAATETPVEPNLNTAPATTPTVPGAQSSTPATTPVATTLPVSIAPATTMPSTSPK